MRWQDYNLTRTVRGKLLIAFAIVLALNIAVGTIGWRGFRDTDGALAGLQSRVIPDIETMQATPSSLIQKVKSPRCRRLSGTAT